MILAEASAPKVMDFRVPNVTVTASWNDKPVDLTTCYVLGTAVTIIYNMPVGGAKVNHREWEIEPAIKRVVPNDWQSWTTSVHHPRFRLKQGRLYMNVPRTIGRKGGNANRYSEEVISAAQQFIERRLVPTDTPMLLTTVSFPHPLGTVAEVASYDQQHDLVLYHGTTAGRAVTIMKQGLRPLATDPAHRQWRDNSAPEWREQAVYLTASPDQAAIYATRAATNARKRRENGQRPVVIRVLIDASLFDHIRPDDDYLRAYGEQAQDWRHGLGIYGQVAVVATIPPDHIELTGINVKNRQASSPL